MPDHDMGTDWDTSIGGAGRNFPTTAWSLVLDAQGEADVTRQTAMETLAKSYWKPIYSYMRARWNKSNEDAKDLTQDFLAWLFTSELLQRADSKKGRFRGLIKSALEFYLRSEDRKKKRLKRGGAQPVLSLDAMIAGGTPDVDAGGRAPEDIFDDAWRSEVLTRATDLARERYAAEGKEVYFDVFQDYFLSESKSLDYRQLAAKFGITTTDVSNYLMHAKRRFRDIVTGLVAETVLGMDDLHEEIQALFGETLG